MHKDISLTLDAARGLGVQLPSAAASDSQPARAQELGYAHRGIAALFEVIGQPRQPAAARPRAGVPAASAPAAHP